MEEYNLPKSDINILKKNSIFYKNFIDSVDTRVTKECLIINKKEYIFPISDGITNVYFNNSTNIESISILFGDIVYDEIKPSKNKFVKNKLYDFTVPTRYLNKSMKLVVKSSNDDFIYRLYYTNISIINYKEFYNYIFRNFVFHTGDGFLITKGNIYSKDNRSDILENYIYECLKLIRVKNSTVFRIVDKDTINMLREEFPNIEFNYCWIRNSYGQNIMHIYALINEEKENEINEFCKLNSIDNYEAERIYTNMNYVDDIMYFDDIFILDKRLKEFLFKMLVFENKNDGIEQLTDEYLECVYEVC
jgi:hypothetical protein